MMKLQSNKNLCIFSYLCPTCVRRLDHQHEITALQYPNVIKVKLCFITCMHAYSRFFYAIRQQEIDLGKEISLKHG